MRGNLGIVACLAMLAIGPPMAVAHEYDTYLDASSPGPDSAYNLEMAGHSVYTISNNLDSGGSITVLPASASFGALQNDRFTGLDSTGRIMRHYDPGWPIA